MTRLTAALAVLTFALFLHMADGIAAGITARHYGLLPSDPPFEVVP